MKKIKMLYHDSPALEFTGGYGNSCAVDLYTAEDVEIGAGEFALIDLGLTIKLPKGYKADIRPRSSTFKNFGLLQTNSVGLIDTTYAGENDILKMPVLRPIMQKDMADMFRHFILAVLAGKLDEVGNMKTVEDFQANIDKLVDVRINPVTIPKGTRLCQMEIVKVMEEVEFVAVEKENWGEKDRGGFGSSGK